MNVYQAVRRANLIAFGIGVLLIAAFLAAFMALVVRFA